MTGALLEALRPVNWPLFALVSTRVAGLMLVAPLWSLRAFPMQARAAVAVLLTVLLMPIVPAEARPAAEAPLPLLSLFPELLLGLAIGLSAAVFLQALSVAAEVVSLQMGLSFGAAFGGPPESGTPGIGQLYHHFALAIYAALGGHLILLIGVGDSLRLLPPGAPLDLAAGGPALLAMLGSLFQVAVQVAAPVMVALLITNLALAVLNRAVPQLHTLMVAVPLTVAVGLIVIGSTLPLTAGLVGRWVSGLEAGTFVLLGRLAPVVPVGP